jgi:hypothetical protein
VGIGLDNGQFVLLDPSNGASVSAPFQPATPAGRRVQWNTPVYWDDSQTLVVASDLQQLARLSVGSALRPLAEKDLETPLTGPLCKLGADVAAVRSSASKHELVIFDSLALDEKGKLDLDSASLAGPFGLAEGCLLQTNAKLMLVSSSGQVQWSIDFPKSALLGPPLNAAGDLILAARNGHIWRIEAASGQVIGRTDVGLALSSIPILVSGNLAVGSDEGIVLQLPMPSGLPEELKPSSTESDISAADAGDAAIGENRTLPGRP